MSALSYRVGEAYAQGDAAPRGLSITEHVPLDGSPLSIGPMPFRARGISLVNQTTETLTVTDDRGAQYVANAFTASTFPAGDSLRFTARLAAAVTQGKCTVIVADLPQALNTSQLASLAPEAVTAELGYAEGTIGFTGIVAEATPSTYIVLPSFTLDGATIIYVEVFAAILGLFTVSAGLAALSLWDMTLGVDLGRICYSEENAGGGGNAPRHSIFGRRRMTPAAGAHVFAARYWGTTAGCIVTHGAGGAGSNPVSSMRAYSVPN